MQNSSDFTTLLWGPALSHNCPNSTTAIKPIIYTKPVLCLANTIPVQLFAEFLAKPSAYLSSPPQKLMEIPPSGNGGVYAFLAFTILLQVKIFFFCHFYDLCFVLFTDHHNRYYSRNSMAHSKEAPRTNRQTTKR